MFPEERQIYILNTLKERGRLVVKALSDYLGVSQVTIRSDLSKMEERGILKRTHGGAILHEELENEISFIRQAKLHPERKARIAQVASQMIRDNDKIIIGPGTTTLLLADYLADKHNLTLTTPSIPLVHKISAHNTMTTIIPGGCYRSTSGVLFGPFFQENMKKIFADTVFYGVRGITEEYLFDADLIEAEIIRILIGRARQRILMADGSKIGKVSFAVIAGLDSVDILITDDSANPEVLDRIAGKGVDVVIAQ